MGEGRVKGRALLFWPPAAGGAPNPQDHFGPFLGGQPGLKSGVAKLLAWLYTWRVNSKTWFVRWLTTVAVLACALGLTPAGADADWQRVAAVNVAQPEQTGFVEEGAAYQYSAGEVPETVVPTADARRTVLFAGRLAFGFHGLKPEARYQVRATFLSDSNTRAMEVRAGETVLEPRLALPSRQILAKTWDLSAAAFAGSDLELTFTALAGANAVVSSLEIWSTDPRPLTGPAPLTDRLAQIETPLPRLSPLPAEEKWRLSLNGAWKFAPRLPEHPEQLSAGDTEKWQAIVVPGEWVMQGFHVEAKQSAAYVRAFTLPKAWRGQRIKLRFDTVHSRARVWLNGQEVGGHEGGFVPFELDVTAAVKPGVNTLLVAAASDSRADILASATQYAGHPLGGITRKVTLFAVPPVNLAALALTTVFDHGYTNATLKARVELANESGVAAGLASLRFKLLGPSGREVVLAPAEVLFNSFGGLQTLSREIALPVAAPAKWDPEHPNLYTVQVELRAGGGVETVAQRFGFRQVEVRGNQVFVNGQSIKLHGVCRHETDPLRGRSLTPELWRRDAELFRAANVNYIRTSHYPPAEEFLAACDELGLFVECEAPLCWVQHGANSNWQYLNYRDPGLFPYLMRANQENVVFNRNHPSIIVWSLANESRWSPLFAEVNRRVKALDPSRPTSFHDQCWGGYNNARSAADLAVYHYPDTNGPAKCDAESRPTLFGEYCHMQTYNQREHFTDPGVRDQWGPRFGEMYDLMYRHPGCLGGAIWSGIDDAFHLPDGVVEGYGYWGVIDGWRRAKPETFHVRKAYSPIRVTTTKLALGLGPLALAVENRYDFTSLKEVGIRWQLGRQQGTVNADIPARNAGTIVIAPPNPPVAGETLWVTFTDPRGFVCEAVELPVGELGPVWAAPKPLALGPLTVTTNAGIITISGRHLVCAVEARSGQIRQLQYDGRTLITAGPALMLLPLEGGPCEPRDLRQFGAFNDPAKHWRAQVVGAHADADGGATLTVEGAYDEAEGHYSLRFGPEGSLDLRYDFRATKAVNPRQAGMVFFVPRALDTLRWDRRADWSAYPPDHIGRPSGQARANANGITNFTHLAAAPKISWSQDANILGTADFRSTKAHVLDAALQDDRGAGLFLHGDGAQAARAFADGDRIGWLIAAINAGGGEGFFGTHHAPDRRPLKAGARIQDTIHLQLVGR